MCHRIMGLTPKESLIKTHALRICLGVFLVLSGYSAHGQDATYDTDIDFSKFKTYKWVTLKSVTPIDSLTDEQIRTTLDAALASRDLARLMATTLSTC